MLDWLRAHLPPGPGRPSVPPPPMADPVARARELNALRTAVVTEEARLRLLQQQIRVLRLRHLAKGRLTHE